MSEAAPRKDVFCRHSNWSVVIIIRLSCPSIVLRVGILRGFKVENILDTSRFFFFFSLTSLNGLSVLGYIGYFVMRHTSVNSSSS